MPLIIFVKGIPAIRRERIETAVLAGGKHVSGSFEAWISVDPFRGEVVVLLTGSLGFERTARFALDAEVHEVVERNRAGRTSLAVQWDGHFHRQQSGTDD